jgi:hypothetical protein
MGCILGRPLVHFPDCPIYVDGLPRQQQPAWGKKRIPDKKTPFYGEFRMFFYHKIQNRAGITYFSAVLAVMWKEDEDEEDATFVRPAHTTEALGGACLQRPRRQCTRAFIDITFFTTCFIRLFRIQNIRPFRIAQRWQQQECVMPVNPHCYLLYVT